MKVIGIGNALVDILTNINSYDILKKLDLPLGSMQLVDANRMKAALNESKGYSQTLASGGSAANTIHGLGQLGVETGFIGKIGNDELGRFFENDMKSVGIKTSLAIGNDATGTALAFITPDSERTFAVYLGAAIELSSRDLSAGTFLGYDMLHIEGYLVQNQALIETAVKLAKESGLKVSLDLASYNVVDANREFLHRIISEYVDIVFANEEEAKSFTGKSPEESLGLMAKMVDIAVVKIGSKGSLIQKGNEVFKVGVIKAKPIDTTGAGDLYAAGFIFGLSKNLPLSTCGELGALLSGNVIETIGPKMQTEVWEKIHSVKHSIIIEGKSITLKAD
jgi:sugar/nucleoside kinase (ribokinase family)